MPATWGSGALNVVPELQTDATLSQANPVSGTQYTVLDTTPNVRVLTAQVYIDWDVEPTTLEMHMTVDGITITFSVAPPTDTTSYYPRWNVGQAMATQTLVTATDYVNRSFFLEARSIKITVEVTGGTTASLAARVKYERW